MRTVSSFCGKLRKKVQKLFSSSTLSSGRADILESKLQVKKMEKGSKLKNWKNVMLSGCGRGESWIVPATLREHLNAVTRLGRASHNSSSLTYLIL